MLLARARVDIQQAFPTALMRMFQPSWLLIVTWSNVTYGGSTNPQAVSLFIRLSPAKNECMK
jgi:hypothetical protein